MTAVGDLTGRAPEPAPGGRASEVPRRLVLGEGATMAIRREAGALVVEVGGLADGSWADSLTEALLSLGPDEKVVIDINEATLVNPASICEVLDELVAAGDDPHRICLVCERLSAIVLLRRYGVTEQVAVFGSPRDALQASLLERDGYGEGWAPTVS